jgi:hypothetical protein
MAPLAKPGSKVADAARPVVGATLATRFGSATRQHQTHHQREETMPDTRVDVRTLTDEQLADAIIADGHYWGSYNHYIGKL